MGIAFIVATILAIAGWWKFIRACDHVDELEFELFNLRMNGVIVPSFRLTDD